MHDMPMAAQVQKETYKLPNHNGKHNNYVVQSTEESSLLAMMLPIN